MDKMAVIILLCTLCIALVSCQQADVSKCPPELTRDTYLTARGDLCYRFVLYQTRIQTNAVRECAAHGGQLVTVKDVATENFIRDVMRRLHYHGRVWIGLNDMKTEGEYVWNSGEKVSYTNWAPHEPTLFLSAFEDCTALDADKDMQWLDEPCHLQSYRYICEYYKTDVVRTTIATQAPVAASRTQPSNTATVTVTTIAPVTT